MSSRSNFIIWLIVISIVDGKPAVSYNQPKLCSYAAWNPRAITFADDRMNRFDPYGVFINTDNTVYVTDQWYEKVKVWPNGSTIPTREVSFTWSTSLFVTVSGDIYIGYGWRDYFVNKSLMNTTSSVQIWSVDKLCTGLFVDLNNTIYCSMKDAHKVIRKSLNSDANTELTAIGRGSRGSGLNQLNEPHGIFVDTNFDLYVADCGNDRVQRFKSGQLDGTTVAGSGLLGTITLYCPTGIVLDADNYLFIVDAGNHRIVGSGPNGFKCVVGCDGIGSKSHQLNNPRALSFDSYGNMYVTDHDNYRVQKFALASNSCVLSYNQPRFCPDAIWSPHAITIANNSILGNESQSIFINNKNNIYVADRGKHTIHVWFENNTNPVDFTLNSLQNPISIFVTITGDIYVGDSDPGIMKKLTENALKIVDIKTVEKHCFGLFVDISNNLYCSMKAAHKVVKISLNKSSTPLVVIGTGYSGSSSETLNNPHGIFVDTNFDLYVADCNNHRIQRFRPEEKKGTTVAEKKTFLGWVTFRLNFPQGVVLDAAGNLFIVDSGENRIVRSGPNGLECVVGCYGKGSEFYQLNTPQALSFDSYGNMFVTDQNNHRIQKFVLEPNSCDQSTTTQKTPTSTINTENSTNAIQLTASTEVVLETEGTIVSQSKTVSYNQPKFCPNATWNPAGTIFVDEKNAGKGSHDIFIDTKNMVYMAVQRLEKVRVWSNGTLIKEVSDDLKDPTSLFVTTNGDIYIVCGRASDSVRKLPMGTTYSSENWSVSEVCTDIFVDLNNTLYCSMTSLHQVIKKPSNSNANKKITAAGTDTSGSESNELNEPYGIFVDINFDLYVADCGNDRIQHFWSGQLNGTTVAGWGTPGLTIKLSCPTGIVLDADKYLFIVDSGNNRIVGSGPEGFRCLIGCSDKSSSESDQLNGPQTLTFDSSGNMYVTDQNKHRIQQFLLESNFCDLTSTTTSIMTTPQTMVERQTSISQPLQSFVPQHCGGSPYIGLYCNESSSPCDILKPCQHNGTCHNTDTTDYGYNCLCPPGFNGTRCEFDHRPCKPHTCLDHGICNETENGTFNCTCDPGWQGIHCESMINLCENVTCMNNGVCRPLLLNYTCECLGDNYFGRHCEFTAKRITILKTVSTSFAYVAIIAMASVAMFIIIMDILKYCFGIDPVRKERERLRRKKEAKKPKPRVIQRFVYVNGPSSSAVPTSTTDDTTA